LEPHERLINKALKGHIKAIRRLTKALKGRINKAVGGLIDKGLFDKGLIDKTLMIPQGPY
jgi:hypothetical protein